ncbi:hypothetical protein CEUSTIGMA_g1563.t1 [Chlamydomonas eustigma]|uniref:Flagellar associated protein n=1 Tax=Chlamydomonas eustigma TaxID=1157962 RepID=A0A250WTF5_9CHLO|nr:hypothetical protein CEUSTIGMA_g1563.t1 [Chlamydomonas eustigma]|eukprot:GAX74114.1 hypothetical protein CEUSTIGMA_g1563.t1 [Chlamydomonas eustigma]
MGLDESRKPLGKPVTTPLTVQKFATTSNNIAGTSTNLGQSLKEIEADLKKDVEGRKEFEDYLAKLEKQKAELRKRIEANKTWIENFEKNDTSGNFEMQYKELVEKIHNVYDNAKEFHSKGIDMLIKDFDYHLAYKRWSDSFSGVPFKPK